MLSRRVKISYVMVMNSSIYLQNEYKDVANCLTDGKPFQQTELFTDGTVHFVRLRVSVTGEIQTETGLGVHVIEDSLQVPSDHQIPRFTSKCTIPTVLSDSIVLPPDISFAFNLLYMVNFTFSLHLNQFYFKILPN